MRQVQLLETFNIHQKKEALGKYDFKNQAVAIIVPMFDESHRVIQEEDRPLYKAQQADAKVLFEHIASTQEKGRVRILGSGDEANETDERFDHLILLHEFVAFEQEYVVEGLRENNPQLQISELN